ncbi:MAG: nucleotide exchange factor GrpE [Firmicutes bacterium]|nr:nucleotide exchange factor GrpE [Bacillota bacterium]MDY5586445.1 nucleotide exchange factor GrpE [Eubacteriales bacterium]
MSKKEKEKEKKECCCENECCNEHKCDCECSCEPEKNEYLEMAQRIQAEFDNYRKRSNDIVKVSRQDGIIDAVLRFLPAIDAIGKAKQMITDPKTLEGINLIEKEFKNSLKALNIEEIEAQGKVFDPKFHNVIAVKYDNSLGDSVITDVYQAGYKIGDRVLRYSQVIVNKVKENN